MCHSSVWSSYFHDLCLLIVTCKFLFNKQLPCPWFLLLLNLNPCDVFFDSLKGRNGKGLIFMWVFTVYSIIHYYYLHHQHVLSQCSIYCLIIFPRPSSLLVRAWKMFPACIRSRSFLVALAAIVILIFFVHQTNLLGRKSVYSGECSVGKWM